ncbi:MAG: NADH-quinone oxidoreductase subunit M [Methylococcales bacterium]|nr:NADH-quinone oxidoreductase subunit M [Methylococcales bacterium]
MSPTQFPVLSFIILWPILGAIVTSLSSDIKLSKKIALWTAIFELILTLIALGLFNSANGNTFQLEEHYAWIPRLNIHYALGIDGISILFLPMTALLSLSAIIATWNSVQQLRCQHFALLLFLEGITIGVFSATDTMLFFLFWELTLPPLFFLIGLWGIGPKRRGAAMKYTLFMLFGGVPLLFGIILLAMNHATAISSTLPEDLCFDLVKLLETPLADPLQLIVFSLLLLGFAAKAPLVPFHTWLPTTTMEGPSQVTALLIGLKLGLYGILRFALPLAPEAAVEYSWGLGILGAITLIYAGLIALQQTNLRRLLAYASISHVGLVLIGIASLTLQGIQGALFQLFNFTLISSSLMLIAGFIQQRLGSTETLHLGGLAKVTPLLTSFYFIFMLASIGLPGTSGFPAELLIILGALTAHHSLGISALAGAVLSAAYMLSFTRKAFLGPITRPPVTQLHDLRPREIGLLCIPALLIIVLGFAPAPLLKINQTALEAWLSHLLDPPKVEHNEIAQLNQS